MFVFFFNFFRFPFSVWLRTQEPAQRFHLKPPFPPSLPSLPPSPLPLLLPPLSPQVDSIVPEAAELPEPTGSLFDSTASRIRVPKSGRYALLDLQHARQAMDKSSVAPILPTCHNLRRQFRGGPSVRLQPTPTRSKRPALNLCSKHTRENLPRPRKSCR